MYLILCPGIHDPRLTQSFANCLREESEGLQTGQYRLLVFPAASEPPYSGPHVLGFVQQQLSGQPPDRSLQTPLVFIGFSAGVVGAIGAAWGWQALGGTVKALIAIDGWGVPLGGNFPIHRLSHDYFTHWSSALLGAGADSFYADPPVEHLDLWRSPPTARGWSIAANPSTPKEYTTALGFITALLQQYGE